VYLLDLCSNQHVPGFITQAEQLKAKGVDEILLISGRFLPFFFLSVKKHSQFLELRNEKWINLQTYCFLRYCGLLMLLALYV
jgi:hypothetical protein